MVSLAYIVPLWIASAAAQDADMVNCGYGEFEIDPSTGTPGVCSFDCEYNDERYIARSALSFDFIKEECPNVRYAAAFYPEQCNSLADLVYPSECGWSSEYDFNVDGCPFCGCAEASTTPVYDTFTQYVSKECLSTTCQAVTNEAGESALVYLIDSVLSAYGSSAALWNDFACPPETCTFANADTGESAVLAQGQTWIPDTAAGVCGDTFCYCSSQGTASCQPFTALASAGGVADALLSDVFIDECDYYLTDCLNDGSRVINRYGYSCGGCYYKRCDCGSHSVGDEWHTGGTDSDGDAFCSQCTCVADDDGNYADCERQWSFSSTSTCPPTSSVQCHGDYQDDLAVATVFEVSNTSSPEDCYYGESGRCGWDIYVDDGDTDYDVSWGCQQDFVCEALIGDNECVFYNEEISYTDCYGVDQTEVFKGYHSCCSGDNCNYADVDISQCTESATYGNIIRELYGCLYADNGASSFWEYECSTDNLEPEGITCQGIQNYVQAPFECYCVAYGSLYSELTSADSRAQLQQALSELGQQLAQYNDIFDCTIFMSCNLDAGGVFDVSQSRPSGAAEKNSLLTGLFGVACSLLIALLN